jgi:hypothetical protein
MAEHVHGCLNCRPDMVPDFDRADPRYHDGSKCGSGMFSVRVDGVEPGYTCGVYEGAEGWALVAGSTTEVVHVHSCAGGTDVCYQPRFGKVEVTHLCPAEVRRVRGW